jgi:hypothetical protein
MPATLPLQDDFSIDVAAPGVPGSFAPDGTTKRLGSQTDAFVRNRHLAVPPGAGWQGIYWSDASEGPVQRQAGRAALIQFIPGDVQSVRQQFGWFTTPAPGDTPAAGDAALYIESAGSNISFWYAARAGDWAEDVSSRGNVPVAAAVALRSSGYAAFVSSVPGARNLAGYPSMEPFWFSTAGTGDVYPGYFTNGGFEPAALTRFDAFDLGAEAAQPEFPFAAIADPGTGAGALGADLMGNAWGNPSGWSRTGGGLANPAGDTLIGIDAGEPLGLISVDVRHSSFSDRTFVRFRVVDAQNYLELEFWDNDVYLWAVEGGSATLLGQAFGVGMSPGSIDRLLIKDLRGRVQVFVDGQRKINLVDSRFPGATGLQLRVSAPAGAVRLSNVAAFPREIPVPESWPVAMPYRPAQLVEVHDDGFSGTAGAPLGAPYTRRAGDEQLLYTAGGDLKVDAPPAPDDLLYSLDVSPDEALEIELQIRAPLDAFDPGQDHFMGGWFGDVAGNYLAVFGFANNAQGPTSTEIESSENGGAIINRVNLADAIQAGQVYSLRVWFNGDTWIAWLNGAALLAHSRSVESTEKPPLAVARAGLIVRNGDTGGGEFVRLTVRNQQAAGVELVLSAQATAAAQVLVSPSLQRETAAGASGSGSTGVATEQASAPPAAVGAAVSGSSAAEFARVVAASSLGTLSAQSALGAARDLAASLSVTVAGAVRFSGYAPGGSGFERLVSVPAGPPYTSLDPDRDPWEVRDG